MTYPKWLYYILKKDGRSGKIVNGVPTFTGIPTPLPQTPQGWQEINLAFERGLDKHGLSTQFSLQFGYVLDGSHLLRDAIYNRTTEDELFLLIQRLSLITTLTTYDWYYKYFVKMEIDLSQAEDEQDYFKSPLLGTGLEKLIKANYDTDYSFPMDDPEAVNLEMDGIEIQGVYKWIFPERPTDGDFDVFPYMAVLESNEKAPGIAAFDVPNENEFTGTIDINSTDYGLTATTMAADTTGIFTATINVTSLVSGPIEFLLTIFNTISEDITQIQLMDPQTGPAGTYTMNKEVDLKNGDRYFFTAAES
jgi:hypothetical protein